MEQRVKHEELIERIAITIYQHEGGLSPEDYFNTVGTDRKNWINKMEFQKDKLELVEHERDEYRHQANEVIDVLLRLGVIEIKTIK